MSASRATHSTSRRWAGAIITASLVAGVSGCSWHLEQEPVVYPSADEVTLERDAAAAREHDILDAIGEGGGDDIFASDLASFEAQAVPVHLEALGGYYIPYPSPEPSPSPFPGSLEVAVTQARDGALETAQTTTDSDLAFLQSSMGLTHAFALWWTQNGDLSASAEPTPSPSASQSSRDDLAGQAEPDVASDSSPTASSGPAVSATPETVTAEERALPTNVDLGDSFTPESGTELSPVTAGDLALAHDKARFLYEVIAAKSFGAERANALARRTIHADRAAEFAALAGAEDRRQPLYDIPPEDVDSAESRATTARATEFALGATYAAMLDEVSSQSRGWILNAAFDAYAAGALQLGFSPDKFPVLPGVTAPSVGEPTPAP